MKAACHCTSWRSQIRGSLPCICCGAQEIQQASRQQLLTIIQNSLPMPSKQASKQAVSGSPTPL
eukprot:8887530-Prorocentrum_lima.AAC.1